jgi:outer membrane protein TolC
MTRGNGIASLPGNGAIHDWKREFLVSLTAFIVPMLVLSCTITASAQDASQGHGAPTPLSDAVVEAENNNTQIAAADHAWRASAHVAEQVGAIANSQKLSHPDEPQLWDEAARREAETQHAQVDVFRSDVVDQVKSIYLRLAYLYQMYDLDDRGAADLAALIQNEVSKYSLGMGSQAEVLEAQLERTRLLRETTLQHEEVGGLQATLKALLHRPADSPDIIPETVAVTKLKRAASDLFLKAGKQNTRLTADSRMIETQSAQLDAAKADTNSEFSLGYTFPQTGDNYRDDYVLVFNMQRTRGSGLDAQVAADVERLESAHSQAAEDLLRQLAEVQKQYVIVTSSDELMKECKEGLIPQSKAVFQSKLAGYQSDREKFSAVIQAFLEEIAFEDDYLQAVLDHETALAHLETLTGEKLR